MFLLARMAVQPSHNVPNAKYTFKNEIVPASGDAKVLLQTALIGGQIKLMRQCT